MKQFFGASRIPKLNLPLSMCHCHLIRHIRPYFFRGGWHSGGPLRLPWGIPTYHLYFHLRSFQITRETNRHVVEWPQAMMNPQVKLKWKWNESLIPNTSKSILPKGAVWILRDGVRAPLIIYSAPIGRSRYIVSGQITIVHQPRFPWTKEICPY